MKTQFHVLQSLIDCIALSFIKIGVTDDFEEITQISDKGPVKSINHNPALI